MTARIDGDWNMIISGSGTEHMLWWNRTTTQRRLSLTCLRSEAMTIRIIHVALWDWERGIMDNSDYLMKLNNASYLFKRTREQAH